MNAEELKNSFKNTKWAQELSDCMQDKIWHAEGDVWTHSCMVADQVEGLRLSNWNRDVLLLSSFLHDVGKPQCTYEENGRVHSPKHSIVGEALARDILIELDIDMSIADMVCSVVRFHGKPPSIYRNRNIEKTLIELSYLSSNHILYNFAKCDFLGRISDQCDEPLESIELFKEEAEKLNCFSVPFPFVNNHARILYFKNKLSSFHYEPRMNDLFEVVLMCGVAGSGKTTWIEKNLNHFEVISPDQFRLDLKISPKENQGKLYQHIKEVCKQKLRKKESFIFDATNVSREVRSKWLNIFFDYGAKLKIVFLDISLEQILLQNSKRENPVPKAIIEKQYSRFERPDLRECHELEVVKE